MGFREWEGKREREREREREMGIREKERGRENEGKCVVFMLMCKILFISHINVPYTRALNQTFKCVCLCISV